MASSVKTGVTFFTDMHVGTKEDMSDTERYLAHYNRGLLNALGGLEGAVQAKQRTHSWTDMAYRPARTTLNGAVAAGATIFVMAEAKFRPYDYVMCEGEVIKLGSSSDYLTFGAVTPCVRSIGTPGDADHASGVGVVRISKAQAEGQAVSAGDAVMVPGTATNYCQRIERYVIQSDEANRTELYGRPGPSFDDFARQQLEEAYLEAQGAIWFNGVATAPADSSGTYGVCKGIREWLLAAGKTTAMGNVDLAQSHLRTAVQNILNYFDPASPLNAILALPLRQTMLIDTWQIPYLQIQPGDPLVAKYGVQVKRIQIGPMTIDIMGVQILDEAKCGMLVIPQYFKPVTLLPMTFEKLARDGGRDRGLVSCNVSVEVHGEACAGWTLENIKIA